VSDIVIRKTRYGAPAAQTLVAAAISDIAARYGVGDESPVEAVEFDPPEGCFLVAWLDGAPVACGGWRTVSHFVDIEDLPGSTGQEAFGDDVAELKRMFATPAVRGTGVAAALLAAIEESARESGMRRMVLETGIQQPEAIAFYARCGYQQIPNYGFYRAEPDCRSFGRDL
jgi:GNAT superfamily N-acetyltransferase